MMQNAPLNYKCFVLFPSTKLQIFSVVCFILIAKRLHNLIRLTIIMFLIAHAFTIALL
jgi:hypothetical protein